MPLAPTHLVMGMCSFKREHDCPHCLQADPRLIIRKPQLLHEFEAAPWLLPSRTKVLPYAGVHDFDRLLELRAQPAGSYNKSIALLLFNKGWSIMAQNSSECVLRNTASHSQQKSVVGMRHSQLGCTALCF